MAIIRVDILRPCSVSIMMSIGRNRLDCIVNILVVFGLGLYSRFKLYSAAISLHHTHVKYHLTGSLGSSVTLLKITVINWINQQMIWVVCLSQYNCTSWSKLLTISGFGGRHIGLWCLFGRM